MSWPSASIFSPLRRSQPTNHFWNSGRLSTPRRNRCRCARTSTRGDLGMDCDPVIELIPIARLREMFNEAKMSERAMYGDLFSTLEEAGHPSPPLAGEPFCTRSQILAYRDDNGAEVARVH